MSNNTKFLQSLKLMLTRPSTNVYLPKLLHDPSGNSADPLNASRLDLGTHSVDKIDVGIVLEGVVAKGLSNVQPNFVDGKADIQISGDTLTFSYKMPNTQAGYTRPSDVPDHLIMQSSFDSTINNEALDPGSISVSVKTASLTGSFRLTGEHVNDVVVTFTSLKVSADCTPDNIQIDITLDTVLLGIIQTILNRPDNLQKIIDQMNSVLAEPSTLAQLNNYTTQAARSALAGDFG